MRLGRIAALVLVSYLVVLLLMMSIENWLIFHPLPYPAGWDWHPAGLFEDAWFVSAGGAGCTAGTHPTGTRRRPCSSATATPATSPIGPTPCDCWPTGSACRCWSSTIRASAAARQAHRRGHSGRRAAARACAGRAEIPEREVVLLGESIGGAVAVDLAARDGAKALVLESTFDRLPDVAAYHVPWLPVRWLMQTRLVSAAEIGKYHACLVSGSRRCRHDRSLGVRRRFVRDDNEPKMSCCCRATTTSTRCRRVPTFLPWRRFLPQDGGGQPVTGAEACQPAIEAPSRASMRVICTSGQVTTRSAGPSGGAARERPQEQLIVRRWRSPRCAPRISASEQRKFEGGKAVPASGERCQVLIAGSFVFDRNCATTLDNGRSAPILLPGHRPTFGLPRGAGCQPAVGFPLLAWRRQVGSLPNRGVRGAIGGALPCARRRTCHCKFRN